MVKRFFFGFWMPFPQITLGKVTHRFPLQLLFSTMMHSEQFSVSWIIIVSSEAIEGNDMFRGQPSIYADYIFLYKPNWWHE